MRVGNKYIHITSFQMIILAFLGIIVFGGILLMLPISTADHHGAGFLDAMFTAVSAVCVTGLVVQDTARYWSVFGQAVIICLIQIGGFGIITVVIAFVLASGKKIGLMQRSTLQNAISAPQLGGVVRLTRFILKMGFIVELCGACILAVHFSKSLGIVRGIWHGIFHSISAFCNAGFDLNGYAVPYSSLTAYAADPVVNIVIMLLIIIGGLGFLTWADIIKCRRNYKKYRMQTKAVLLVTAFLLAVPAIYFFLAEFTHMPMGERLLASLFQAVTPRTAGFNTVDLTKISETGRMLTIMLMLIGGAPGSTAGGMKVTTIAVLAANAVAVFQKKDSPHIFGRRIPDDSIRSAATLLYMYVGLAVIGAMVISRLDQVPLMTALFETASAIGTVGLTLGITSSLGDISHVILMVLMFLGRVGCLTLVYAAFAEKKISSAKLPQEKITVG